MTGNWDPHRDPLLEAGNSKLALRLAQGKKLEARILSFQLLASSIQLPVSAPPHFGFAQCKPPRGRRHRQLDDRQRQGWPDGCEGAHSRHRPAEPRHRRRRLERWGGSQAGHQPHQR
jgi:hypothetical protein